MKMDMKRACSNCPFRRDGGIRLRRGRILEIANMMLSPGGGVFPCHKTTVLTSDGDDLCAGDKSQHCAGALIFADKNDTATQYMRIASRIGFDVSAIEGRDEIFDSKREWLETAIGGKRNG